MTTGEIIPDEDAVPNNWSVTTGTPRHDQINEDHGSPNNYTYVAATEVNADDNDLEQFGFTTLDDIVDNSIVSIRVYTYGAYLTGGTPEIAVSWDGGVNFTAYVECNIPSGGQAEFDWTFNQWLGLSYSKSDLDQFQVSYRGDCAPKLSGNTVCCVYVVVTYTEVVEGWAAGKPLGVAPADIAKVMGVAIADIAEVKGV